MIPVLVEDLIQKVLDKNTSVYSRQYHANTLREIVTRGERALTIFDEQYRKTEQNIRK